MIVFHSETSGFFVLDTWDQPRPPPGPLDGPDMFLGLRHIVFAIMRRSHDPGTPSCSAGPRDV